MRISSAARLHLEALLADSERGSVVSLLLGYTYDENWGKHPQVDIAVLPPDRVELMKREHSRFGDQLIQVLDGFTFALPLSDDNGLLDGQILTYAADHFSLVRAST